jgi:hypothetical protein
MPQTQLAPPHPIYLASPPPVSYVIYYDLRRTVCLKNSVCALLIIRKKGLRSGFSYTCIRVPMLIMCVVHPSGFHKYGMSTFFYISRSGNHSFRTWYRLLLPMTWSSGFCQCWPPLANHMVFSSSMWCIVVLKTCSSVSRVNHQAKIVHLHGLQNAYTSI